MNLLFPSLRTNNTLIDQAFRIALGDLAGNIQPYKDGLLRRRVPCILAGLEYDTPWTRDTAINVWNGAALLLPEISRNTLLSVLIRDPSGKARIGGQYWDAIIWVTGAWQYYLITADKKFLGLAFEASRHSLQFFEETEFDEVEGLFRGLACYGDGRAAYPDVYGVVNHGLCGIGAWGEAHPDQRAKKGVGTPMFALSTNCLYVNAYEIMPLMAKALGRKPDAAWLAKAKALRRTINKKFWMAKKGTYRYLADEIGRCEHQEGLGHSFALLFDIADAKQKQRILKRQHIAMAGIPCVWPPFARYRKDPAHYGRHSGTVWPHIQGFWADACARHGETARFAKELFALAGHAVRDHQFAEIYHPDTGKIYGGLQETRSLSPSDPVFTEPDRAAIRAYCRENIREWSSCNRQTWSATACLRMIFMGLCGMRFTTQGLRFEPTLPRGIEDIALTGLCYGKAVIALEITGRGTRVAAIKVNGRATGDGVIPMGASGRFDIAIAMSDKVTRHGRSNA